MCFLLASGVFSCLFWYGNSNKNQNQQNEFVGKNQNTTQNQENKNKQTEQTNNTIIFKDIVDTSNWKTFRSESLGFEAKYPADIYTIEVSYAPVITFKALNNDLRNKYGDIEVYSGRLKEWLYNNGKNPHGTWNDVLSGDINLGSKTFSVSSGRFSQGCLDGDVMCEVPGEVDLITDNHLYNIRRLVKKGPYFPSATEPIFIQFIADFKPFN